MALPRPRHTHRAVNAGILHPDEIKVNILTAGRAHVPQHGCGPRSHSKKSHDGAHATSQPLLSMERKAKEMRELGLTHFILTQTPLKSLPLQDLKRLVHWHKVDIARTTADKAILLLVPCTLLSTRTKFKRGTPGSN